MQKFGLPRERMIKSRERIRRIQKEGTKKEGELFTLYRTKTNPAREPQVAILVDRDIRKATERNRLKRLVREVVRLNRPGLLKRDAILYIKPRAEGKTFWEIQRELVGVTRKIIKE